METLTVHSLVSRLPDLFAKTHPATAHFPIALLAIALVAETIGCFRKKPQFHFAGKFCLVFGAVGALVTSLSGFPLTTITYNSYSPPGLAWHKYLGLATSAAALLAGLFALIAGEKLCGKLRFFYFFLLLAVAVLTLAAGHTGGVLVSGDDYLCPK